MNLPPNLTESQVLEAIEKVVGQLAPSFLFGLHNLDDIKQTARLYAIQAVSHWDGVQQLERFLYRHVRNRLIAIKHEYITRNRPRPPAAQALLKDNAKPIHSSAGNN